MMSFVSSLIIASLVGTILWIIKNAFKSITQKLFSQTWHYYISLIPIFFFLGGTKVINELIDLTSPILKNRSMGLIKHSKNLNPMDQLLTTMPQSEKIDEIMLWIILIWATGMLIFLMLNIKKYVNFRYFILQNHRVYNTEHSNAQIIISSNATTPIVMGSFNPIVVLPDVQFKDKEFILILSHELVHIKRGDLLIKLVIMITKAVHWFNPAIYHLSKQINDYCELSCDEKVVRKMDAESRRGYGEMILSVLDYGVKKRTNIGDDYVINFCSNKNNVKRRLLNIMNGKKMKKSMVTLSIFASVLLIGIGAYAAYAYESQVPETSKFYKEDYDDSGVKVMESNKSNEITLEVDVPHTIKYQDPYADPSLDIDIEPGKQILMGDEAEAYLKFRKPN